MDKYRVCSSEEPREHRLVYLKVNTEILMALTLTLNVQLEHVAPNAAL